MREYVCTKCGAKSYSSAELQHLKEKGCLKCGSPVKEVSRDHGEAVGSDDKRRDNSDSR